MSLLDEYTQISAQLHTDIDTVLLNEVAETAKQYLQSSILENVYDAYAPTQYERRYSDGGLADPENFVESIAGEHTLEITDIASGNRSQPGPWTDDLDDTIERGEPYLWLKSRIAEMQPYPRPFYKPAEDDFIDSGMFDRTLAEGLNAMGYEVSP